MASGNILVIRGGGIGDFILTLPVLSALRTNFPQTRLDLLGYPHIAELALAGGLVDAVRPIESRPLAGFFVAGGRLEAAWQDYFAGFDLIVSFLYDPDLIFQTNVSRCSKAQFIAGPHRPNPAESVHVTRVLLRTLERLAIFDADPVPCLNLSQPKLASAALPQARQLALHPGSGSQSKNWPEKRWAELLPGLIGGTQLQLLLVGGEAEEQRLARLSAILPSERVRLADRLPLVELARALSQTKAFVGHDSGISHLASALGLPTLVLWGQSIEAVWRPQGEGVVIIRADGGWESLPVGDVLEAIHSLVDR